MLVLKYLLLIAGVAMFVIAAIPVSPHTRPRFGRHATPPRGRY